MSFETVLRDYLKTSTPLLALLTGGIYSFRKDTKRDGLSIKNTPDAYLDGFLKPTMVIKARNEVPMYTIPDADTQFVDTKTIVELYIYIDGDDDIDIVETAHGVIFTLLQDRRISDAFYTQWVWTVEDGVDSSMARAKFNRYDYQISSDTG